MAQVPLLSAFKYEIATERTCFPAFSCLPIKYLKTNHGHKIGQEA